MILNNQQYKNKARTLENTKYHELLRQYIVEGKLCPTIKYLLYNDIQRFVTMGGDLGEDEKKAIKFLHEEAPNPCWGSPENVRKWVKVRPRKYALWQTKRYLENVFKTTGFGCKRYLIEYYGGDDLKEIGESCGFVLSDVKYDTFKIIKEKHT
jgi:hypothetical protein